MEEFFELAGYLTNNSVCTLMGSLCLYLTAPDILGREVHDVDLFSDDTEENLRRIIGLLEDRGFDVFSWQDRIDHSVDMDMLRGRYYIRGIKDGLIADITYESDILSYDELKRYETVNKGIRHYDIEGLILLLSCSDREEHLLQRDRLIKKLSGDNHVERKTISFA